MSEWGIALIAAGSAILGSIVTGFFAWKAGHRQAAAAEAAGREQAAALISTVQATLDEQRRAQTNERQRKAYAEFLVAGDACVESRDEEDKPRLLAAFGLVEIEGPTAATDRAAEYMSVIHGYVTVGSRELSDVFDARLAYVDAVRRALNET